MENNNITSENTLYDKPFKTYEEQIEILKGRNIIISDYQFTQKVLAGLSYYTIVNGYKDTFLAIPNTDNFIPNTTFEQLYTIHIVDTSLNTILLKNILFIERYLKTRIAYHIAQKYGVYTDKDDLSNTNTQDYLCRDNYRRTQGRNNILKRIKKNLSDESTTLSIKHYIEYKNHIPPWILISGLTFGLTVKWYDILKSDDKEDICNQFIETDVLDISDRKEFLKISFNLLREFRNKIAHGNRIFNRYNFPILPKKSLLTLSHGALTENEYNSGYGKNDVYAIILLCFILIDDVYILRGFLHDLTHVLSPYIGRQIINGKTIWDTLNLPKDLLERLEDFLSKKTNT